MPRYEIDVTLKNCIVDEDDKVLFDEIIKCYTSGAFRAAYIMTWVTIVESLKKKLKEMALRDSAVEKFVAEIEEREKEGGYISDKKILEKSKEYGLINSEEYEKLEHIRKMRNIYTHPYQSSPSQEEVIAAIKITVESVLKKPPLLRHGYIKEIISSLVKKPHYIDDDERKIRDFVKSIAYKIHPDTYSYAFRISCEYLESLIKEPNLDRFVKRLIIFMDQLFKCINLNQIDVESWKLNDICERFPEGSAILICGTEIWKFIPELVKDRAIGYLLESNFRDKKSYSIRDILEGKIFSLPSFNLSIVFSLYNKGFLTDSQKNKFLEVINEKTIDYPTLIKAKIPLQLYLDKILNDLDEFYFEHQNRAGRALYDIDPQQFFNLTEEEQEKLGRNVFLSANKNAYDVIRFLDKVSKNPTQYPPIFIRGIFLGAVIKEKNILIFNNVAGFEKIIECMVNCKQEPYFKILEDIIKDINSIHFSCDVVPNTPFEILEKFIQSVEKEFIKKLLLQIKTKIKITY